ncbi:MAG: DNA-deoxyinosine glycosylase, partial [Planctomycetes bacterium]|nr:DNA-deoxyinosine glycosylase [Planctomycetota bacterium]
LGSMPSVASLEKGEYYGHPRNAFWPLMAELFGFEAKSAYAGRVRALTQSGVAVWDVLQSCQREGSLDSAIDRTSEVANDFVTLVHERPSLRHVVLNGRKAEQVWKRAVAGSLDLPTTVLPSTSPAMAALDFAGKLAQWQVVRELAAGR